MFLTTTRRAAQSAPDVYSNLHRLSRMMDEALGGEWNGGTLASAWTPSCDVFEDKENLRIVVELPGGAPEDVKLSLENQVLTIQGEKKQVAEEKSERWHRHEALLRPVSSGCSPSAAWIRTGSTPRWSMGS